MNNIIINNSCKSRKTIQDRFLATGQISRSFDSKEINSCSDLRTLIKCTKNMSVLHNIEKYAKKVYLASQFYKHYRELSEENLLQCSFNCDIDSDNKLLHLKYTN